ncbi:MAG: alpha/beta hydrolase [Butyricicoccaceae bacterium]
MRMARKSLAALLLAAVLNGCAVPLNPEAESKETLAPADELYREGEILERTDTYTVQEIFVECGERELYGVAYLPSEPVGSAVVMSHGYMDRYKRFQPYGEQLAEAGIASYTFDFYGGSPTSKSGNNITKMSVLTEKEDLNAVIDAMMDFMDTDQLYLMGHSQGGLVSAMAANDRTDDIAGMMLIAPAFMIPDMVDRYSNIFQGVKIYVDDARSVQLYDDIDDYTGPVWIVQGDRDELVPLSYAQAAAEAYENAELTVVEGEGHGMVSTRQKELAERAIDFILK